MKACNTNNSLAQNPKYICNPASGRWVLLDGPTGKKLSQGSRNRSRGPTQKPPPKANHKPCNQNSTFAQNPNYICNPASGRWVLLDGPIGRKLSNAGIANPIPRKSFRKSPWPTPRKRSNLRRPREPMGSRNLQLRREPMGSRNLRLRRRRSPRRQKPIVPTNEPKKSNIVYQKPIIPTNKPMKSFKNLRKNLKRITPWPKKSTQRSSLLYQKPIIPPKSMRKKKTIRTKPSPPPNNLRELYKNPARNYRCVSVQPNYIHNNQNKTVLQNILSSCTRNISNIKIRDMIGEGSFGRVYKGKARFGNEDIDIALKVIEINNSTENNIDQIYSEIEFSYYMGENDIGPKMYDAFFIYNPKTKLFIQYIIMEPFDMDCHSALESDDLTTVEKGDIFTQMVNLYIEQLFEYGLECHDIKPANYVYNRDKNIVRIIDFGVDWCIFKQDSPEYYKETTLVIMVLQLLELIRHLVDVKTYTYFLSLLDNYPFFQDIYSYVDNIYTVLNDNIEYKRVFEYYTGAVISKKKDITYFIDYILKPKHGIISKIRKIFWI